MTVTETLPVRPALVTVTTATPTNRPAANQMPSDCEMPTMVSSLDTGAGSVEGLVDGRDGHGCLLCGGQCCHVRLLLDGMPCALRTGS